MNKLLRNELNANFKQINDNEYENNYIVLKVNNNGTITIIIKENKWEYTFDKIKIYKRLDDNQSEMKKYYLNDINQSTRVKGKNHSKDYTNIENWEIVETIEL